MPRWHVLLYVSLLTKQLDFKEALTSNVGGEQSEGVKDVYEDGLVLDYLKTKTIRDHVALKEKDRIL